MDLERYNETGSVATSIDVKRTAEIAGILRNSRRIYVMLELESVGEEGLSVGVLADRIAERECGPQFSSKARKAVYVALYQTHIPTLDAWDTDGAINCDRGLITRGSRFNEVMSALNRLQG